MVTIKIKTSDGKVITLKGSKDNPITIKTKGNSSRSASLRVNPETSTALLSVLAIPKADWYNLWLEGKRKAILAGGTSAPEHYKFDRGIIPTYVKNGGSISYIKSISGAKPLPDGRLFILGSKYISLFPRDGKLKLGAITLDNRFCKWLTEIHYFIWRLYHAYNYLLTRLVYFDPARCGMDKNCENRGALGNCLGTLIEYQAQVAIYNHLIWRSAYQLSVDTVVEKVAVGIGFTAQDCDVPGVLMTVKIAPLVEYKKSAAHALNSLTIFRSGTSVQAGANSVNTSDITPLAIHMEKTRSGSGKYIHGTGYEDDYTTTGDDSKLDDAAKEEAKNKDKDPEPWRSITIALVLGRMSRRQRYYEVFSLAVATGIVRALKLPESPNSRFQLEVSTSWTVLDSDYATASCASAVSAGVWPSAFMNEHTVSKSGIEVRPVAVNVLEEDLPEEGEE